MILRRLGNKKKLAAKILPYFPRHTIYIEPFFGAGGMFFHKPKVRDNIVNDYDSDVFNLFQVVSTRRTELERLLISMPVHEYLWNHWKTHKETDPIRKAVRFLFFSNWGYMGKPDTLRYNGGRTKDLILERLDTTEQLLYGVEFMNCDFRKMFKRISFRDGQEKNAFIYCDPPYLDTDDNYEKGFSHQDSADLFDTLDSTRIKWAMSEFDHPEILEQAAQRGHRVIKLGERQNLKNRRLEVLITNYDPSHQELSLF